MLVPVAAGLVHYLVNKPDGLITTADDPQGRPTVMTLVPPEPRVFPVGPPRPPHRGPLAHDQRRRPRRSSSPTRRTACPRSTWPRCPAARPPRAPCAALRQGVELDDGPTAPAEVGVLAPGVLRLVVHEGRNRQVRRMCEAVGHPGAPPRAHPHRTGARHEPGPRAVAPPDGRARSAPSPRRPIRVPRTRAACRRSRRLRRGAEAMPVE